MVSRIRTETACRGRGSPTSTSVQAGALRRLPRPGLGSRPSPRRRALRRSDTGRGRLRRSHRRQRARAPRGRRGLGRVPQLRRRGGRPRRRIRCIDARRARPARARLRARRRPLRWATRARGVVDRAGFRAVAALLLRHWQHPHGHQRAHAHAARGSGRRPRPRVRGAGEHPARVDGGGGARRSAPDRDARCPGRADRNRALPADPRAALVGKAGGGLRGFARATRDAWRCWPGIRSSHRFRLLLSSTWPVASLPRPLPRVT